MTFEQAKSFAKDTQMKYFVIIGQDKLPRFYIQMIYQNNIFYYSIDEFCYNEKNKKFELFQTTDEQDINRNVNNTFRDFVLKTDKIIPYDETVFKDLPTFMKTIYSEIPYEGKSSVCYSILDFNLNYNFSEIKDNIIV